MKMISKSVKIMISIEGVTTSALGKIAKFCRNNAKVIAVTAVIGAVSYLGETVEGTGRLDIDNCVGNGYTTSTHKTVHRIGGGCEINCVNGHGIVKLFDTKGILWLTGHRNN